MMQLAQIHDDAARATEDAPSGASLSATDLAELMASFNDVTSKLERTHAQLRGEVRRLSDELREANEALQRSKRLAALGEMAAGIAHEVRNPLGSIGLYARMLEEDLADRPECRGVATKIGSAVRGLDAVVGDVLTFAKEIRVRSFPGGAHELFQRAVEACGAEAAGLDVRIDVPEDIAFEHDPGLIHQALVNVIRNACDASRASGGSAICLSARKGSVDPSDPDPTPGVVLSVRDRGDGFRPEAIERVFNPFFTTRAAGTGLGLPIVHRIVDAHGGRVVVFNNTPGQSAETRPAGRDESLNRTGVGPEPVGGALRASCRGATVELRLPLRVARVAPEVVVRSGSVPSGSVSAESAFACEGSL
jgi:signal transduction histidine kinase